MGLIHLLFEKSEGPRSHGGAADLPSQFPASSQWAEQLFAHAAVARVARCQIECEITITAACDVSSELRFVRGKNAHALSASGDAHIPLLCIRGTAGSSISKKHMIHGFALRAV